jgi:hypothetical protein
MDSQPGLNLEVIRQALLLLLIQWVILNNLKNFTKVQRHLLLHFQILLRLTITHKIASEEWEICLEDFNHPQ